MSRQRNQNASDPSLRRRALPRKGARAQLSLTALALSATACSASVEPLEPDAVDAQHGFTQAALSVEESNLNPVMVTSGTCNSQGFRPIYDADTCSQAEAMIFDGIGLASGPLASPPFSSAPHGCSLSIDAISIHGDGSLLATVFGEGTNKQIEAQACSHDIPCVCQDDESETPVCRGGEFQPDPHKYYTIRSPNGRYAGVGVEVFPDIQVSLTTELPPSDSRLHWRFAEAGGGLAAVSRHNGQGLNTTGFLGNRLQTGGVQPLSLSCRGSQVLLEQAGLSPLDSSGPMSDGSTPTSTPFVPTEPQSPGNIRVRSNCMKKSRSCESVFGDGFVQVDRRTCGIVGQLHQLTCLKTFGVPLSMHVPQGWYVEEVEAFSRAVNFDPAPVQVGTLLGPAALSDSLATHGASALSSLTTIGAGTVAVVGGPLAGAVFSVSVNSALQLLSAFGVDVFKKPDPVAELAAQVDEALKELAADMEARTQDLISNGLAQESARELTSRMNERRRWFYRELPNLKVSRMALGDPEQTQRLADDVFVAARELGVDIAASFPTLGIPQSELELRRAHFGLDVAKLAMTELLIMLSEGILLEAHALPELSCEQIIFDRALQDRADAFARALEDAIAAFLEYGGRFTLDHRINQSFAEFEFDVHNFSYPIAQQLEFFETRAAETLDMCNRLRDPADSFRADFETNAARLNTDVLP